MPAKIDDMSHRLTFNLGSNNQYTKFDQKQSFGDQLSSSIAREGRNKQPDHSPKPPNSQRNVALVGDHFEIDREQSASLSQSLTMLLSKGATTTEAILYPLTLKATGHLSYDAKQIGVEENIQMPVIVNSNSEQPLLSASNNPAGLNDLYMTSDQNNHLLQPSRVSRAYDGDNPSSLDDTHAAMKLGLVASYPDRYWDKKKMSLLKGADGIEIIIRDYSANKHEQIHWVSDILSQMNLMNKPVGKIWINGHLMWQVQKET